MFVTTAPLKTRAVGVSSRAQRGICFIRDGSLSEAKSRSLAALGMTKACGGPQAHAPLLHSRGSESAFYAYSVRKRI
jgi:hypothetical protein